ncbi:hypothetical protein N7E81_15800 [Reichenbachiella carrageenanivorans]|uniref:Sugar lactone lactonase YvrE n=1 Tax=Reichenbachiella carrageenanivorans TaxID=2979869 RepID=A0ABY6CY31_9BACT|nr:hypothetical protein [Reichenbachiella carrageenanivorans]UXX78820.1 hypothetical protein N7E81_15800 [Reichenbachiella carrageenanivorans]
MKTNILLASLLLAGIACTPTKNKEEAQTPPKTITPPSLSKVWETDTVLTTSESVIYDPFRKVLYVSNINGVPPTAKDNDGFISIINTDGTVATLKWITELSAPKGMGIVDSSLFVANIDEVIEIDIPSGEIIKRHPIEGAQFLNDITVSKDGDVFISDTMTNKIHLLSKGEMTTWLTDSTMKGPNGLLHQGSHIMASSFGGDEYYRIDINTKMIETLTDSIPAGDGVTSYHEHYFVSNWNGEVHFVDSTNARTILIDTKEIGQNAADIYYLKEKGLLLVPTFFANTIAAYQVK